MLKSRGVHGTLSHPFHNYCFLLVFINFDSCQLILVYCYYYINLLVLLQIPREDNEHPYLIPLLITASFSYPSILIASILSQNIFAIIKLLTKQSVDLYGLASFLKIERFIKLHEHLNIF